MMQQFMSKRRGIIAHQVFRFSRRTTTIIPQQQQRQQYTFASLSSSSKLIQQPSSSSSSASCSSLVFQIRRDDDDKNDHHHRHPWEGRSLRQRLQQQQQHSISPPFVTIVRSLVSSSSSSSFHSSSSSSNNNKDTTDGENSSSVTTTTTTTNADPMMEGNESDEDDEEVPNSSSNSSNSNNNSSTTNVVKFYPVYTRYEMEELLKEEYDNNGTSARYHHDASLAVLAPLNLSDIQIQLSKAFDLYRDHPPGSIQKRTNDDNEQQHPIQQEGLEYHNGTQWCRLQTSKDVEALRVSLESHPIRYNRLVPVKLQNYYDEFNEYAGYEEGVAGGDGSQQPLGGVDMTTEHGINSGTATSKQEQTLMVLAHITQQLIQKLYDPKCPYEKLVIDYSKATQGASSLERNSIYIQQPHRLVLKGMAKNKTAAMSSASQEQKEEEEEEGEVSNATDTPATAVSGEHGQQANNPNVDAGLKDILQQKRQRESSIEKQVEEENKEETLQTESSSSTTDKVGKATTEASSSSSFYPDDSMMEEEEEVPEPKSNFVANDGYSIDTRVWIMDHIAKSTHPNDQELAHAIRSVVMAYPHALDHMVNCIHMFDTVQVQNDDTNDDSPNSDNSIHSNDHDHHHDHQKQQMM